MSPSRPPASASLRLPAGASPVTHHTPDRQELTVAAEHGRYRKQLLDRPEKPLARGARLAGIEIDQAGGDPVPSRQRVVLRDALVWVRREQLAGVVTLRELVDQRLHERSQSGRVLHARLDMGTRTSIVPSSARSRRSHHSWLSSGNAPPRRPHCLSRSKPFQVPNAGGTPERCQAVFSFGRTVARPEC